MIIRRSSLPACLTTWKMILNDSSCFVTLLTKHLRNGNFEISFRVTVFTLGSKPVNISVNALNTHSPNASQIVLHKQTAFIVSVLLRLCADNVVPVLKSKNIKI